MKDEIHIYGNRIIRGGGIRVEASEDAEVHARDNHLEDIKGEALSITTAPGAAPPKREPWWRRTWWGHLAMGIILAVLSAVAVGILRQVLLRLHS